MIDYDLPACPRGLESPERYPEGVLDLWAEDNSGPRRQREYKWTHDDGRQHRCPRVQVVENTKPFRGRQIHADFFHRFADCGRQEVAIARIAAAPGKSDLAGPGIPGAHGADTWSGQ